MQLSANDAAFWSCRAAEARSVATQMSDELCRNTMLALAARYERLANRAVGGDIFGRARTDAVAVERSRSLGSGKASRR
jgi:hypothetical protein